MTSFHERAEEQELFRQKNNNANQSNMILLTAGSSGNNQEKLARILSAFDTFIKIMKWTEKDLASFSSIEKDLASFSSIVNQYQGSVDAKYHNDLKDILIAEEIERRRSERKGISILQS